MQSKPSSTPRKKPKQGRSQATVEAILCATTHILTESGYHQLTTNRVAELAGVSIGSLYQYFPNKESLVFALADHHANTVMELAKNHLEVLVACSIPELLTQVVRAAIAAHSVNPKLHQVLHEQIPTKDIRQKLEKANMANLLNSFFVQHADELRPQNLDLAAFLIERIIRASIHGAMIDRPELLQTPEFEQELITMLSGYLLKD